MRRAFLIAGVMTAFAVAVLAAGANFAGTWALDKTKSQGLDPRMQNADVTWVITQDDKQISIETKVAGGQPPAGGPGGGGGMGGGRGVGGPCTYSLDGEEDTSEAGGQIVVRHTTKS